MPCRDVENKIHKQIESGDDPGAGYGRCMVGGGPSFGMDGDNLVRQARRYEHPKEKINICNGLSLFCILLHAQLAGV